MSITKESILKAILLKEFDRMQPEISTFEDDPMQFILRKYQGLNKVLTYLMTPSFEEYITGIYIVAPKPTTFKIVLHNGQFFFLQFMGKAYQATVAGKNYYLMNIGEKERCMLAIARILRFGNPLKTKGPEGAEQGTREGGEEGGGGESAGGEEVPEATPEEGGGEEETIAEARILEEVLKKNLQELINIKEQEETSSEEKKSISNIFDELEGADNISKTEIFDKLSEYTYKHIDLGPIRQVFPNPGENTIPNWKKYVNKKYKNESIGKKIESCIIEYSKKNGVQASHISGGKGEDANIGGKIVEIKSSKTSTINTQLQTTFYSNEKMYLFVTNTNKEDIQIRLVSGKVLRQLSFGKDVMKGEVVDEEKLENQIKKGIDKFNFKETIKKSLVQGSTEKRETSFNIGNKIRIRFLVFFEPQYGKKKKSNKSALK